MSRFHKLLLVILGVVFLTWADHHYAQHKYNKKIMEAVSKSDESKH